MAKNDMVIFTSSWNKNKNGVYPCHVIDIMSYDEYNKLISSGGFYSFVDRYVSILSPHDTNLRYTITHSKISEFKKEHTNTGRKKYKIAA